MQKITKDFVILKSTLVFKNHLDFVNCKRHCMYYKFYEFAAHF